MGTGGIVVVGRRAKVVDVSIVVCISIISTNDDSKNPLNE